MAKKEIPKNQREIQKQVEVQTKEALGTQAGTWGTQETQRWKQNRQTDNNNNNNNNNRG